MPALASLSAGAGADRPHPRTSRHCREGTSLPDQARSFPGGTVDPLSLKFPPTWHQDGMGLEWLPKRRAGRLKTTGHGVGRAPPPPVGGGTALIREVMVPPNRRRQGCLNKPPRPPDPWLPLPFGNSSISPRAREPPSKGAAPLLLGRTSRRRCVWSSGPSFCELRPPFL